MLLESGMFLFISLVMLVLAGATVAASVVIVRPTEVAAYFVLGEYRGILDSGIHFLVPFVADIRRYEETAELTVTEEANTADGGRVEATVQVTLERGDIARAFETDDTVASNPIPELRSEVSDRLREALRDRDTETALSAHVDIERSLAGDLRHAARERYYHLESVDTMTIDRVERPAVADN